MSECMLCSEPNKDKKMIICHGCDAIFCKECGTEMLSEYGHCDKIDKEESPYHKTEKKCKDLACCDLCCSEGEDDEEDCDQECIKGEDSNGEIDEETEDSDNLDDLDDEEEIDED